MTKNAEETQTVARLFAREILRDPVLGKKATVVALSGKLGGGKTTFAQGFAEGLGVMERVKSPTFVLMKKFALESKKFTSFYHLDCYRLENEKEVGAIGLPEILEDPRNLVLIEWAEKIKSVLPKQKVTVTFSHVDEHTRKISFN